MRTAHHTKPTKSKYRQKVNKKRYKSKSTVGCTPCGSILNLGNINEAIRINVNKRSEGSWKVVPKDSCEVYKERRKRKAESRKNCDDVNNMSNSDNRKRQNSRKNAKTFRKKAASQRQKLARRRKEDSSITSLTTSTFSLSSSEMDYE